MHKVCLKSFSLEIQCRDVDIYVHWIWRKIYRVEMANRSSERKNQPCDPWAERRSKLEKVSQSRLKLARPPTVRRKCCTKSKSPETLVVFCAAPLLLLLLLVEETVQLRWFLTPVRFRVQEILQRQYIHNLTLNLKTNGTSITMVCWYDYAEKQKATQVLISIFHEFVSQVQKFLLFPS